MTEESSRNHGGGETAVFGTLVVVDGRGLLITGPAGLGKSQAALELLSRGHQLVADDYVLLRRTGDGRVAGRTNPIGGDFIEVRGLGIMNAQRLYGAAAIATEAVVELVVTLLPRDAGARVPLNRLAPRPAQRHLLGVPVPGFELPVAADRPLAVLIEALARTHGQRLAGYDPLHDFARRQAAELS